MADGVGEGLLDDAVRRQPDPVGRRRAVTLPHHLHPEPRSQDLLGERGQLRQPRLRRVLGVPPQQAQHAAHLGEGLPAHLALRLKGPGHRVVGAQHLPRRAGLHHHEAHVVGDDVV